MGDLISREAAVKALMEQADMTKDTKSDVRVSEFFVSAACAILRMHAVDAEPVRRGNWEKRTYWIGSFGENQMVCSECGKKYGFHAPYNYCPNCGAKMDGENDG